MSTEKETTQFNSSSILHINSENEASSPASHSDQVADNATNEKPPPTEQSPSPQQSISLYCLSSVHTSNTSAQAINLTITIYIIFQALSPAVFGPLSDSIGRRLVFLITLALYALGNLGLALNKSSLATLLVLQAIQSLGASAAFAVSYGVVADACVPSERGRMLGPVSMALNLGACVGPVVGGTVVWTSGSYEWVFWALVIVGLTLWVFVGLFLPETARALVGSGSPEAERRWWEESWLIIVKRWLFDTKEEVETKARSDENAGDVPARKPLREQWRSLNPLTCLRVMFHWDTFFVLWMQGSFYVVDYTVVAAMPDIFSNIYQFNELQIGLTYIPRGIGIIAGGYSAGTLMDYDYKTVAREIGWKIDKVAGDDLLHFPIERTRARGSYFLLILSTAVLLGYGWSVTKHAHLAVVLILQFMQGFSGAVFYNIYNVLLVDVFPESPSTAAAAAAASIVRCAMAAADVAILQPLLDALDRGWYFTILGIWSGGCGALAVLVIQKKGMSWRTRRIRRKNAKDSADGG